MKSKSILHLFLYLFGILFIATSCLDKDECTTETYTSPAAFALIIVNDEGENLIGEDGFQPDSIVMYYNSEIGVTLVNIYLIGTEDGPVLVSVDLPGTILETSNNNYFLYLNSADTDTLNVMVTQMSDGCNIWYNYTEFKYNGVDMEIDPSGYYFIGVK